MIDEIINGLKKHDGIAAPKEQGVYFVIKKNFSSKDDIVYVGSATGKNGLHQRIDKQHLSPTYRKSDDEEISVFRKKIKTLYNCSDSSSTLEAIKDKYEFYYLVINMEYTSDSHNENLTQLLASFGVSTETYLKKGPTKIITGVVLALECAFIDEFQPMYNKVGKRSR